VGDHRADRAQQQPLEAAGAPGADDDHVRVGRRTEEFTAKEVPEDERVPLLRAYLEKWKWEVGAFFGGVGPDASDEELRHIAPDHPAFRID